MSVRSDQVTKGQEVKHPFLDVYVTAAHVKVTSRAVTIRFKVGGGPGSFTVKPDTELETR